MTYLYVIRLLNVNMCCSLLQADQITKHSYHLHLNTTLTQFSRYNSNCPFRPVTHSYSPLHISDVILLMTKKPNFPCWNYIFFVSFLSNSTNITFFIILFLYPIFKNIYVLFYFVLHLLIACSAALLAITDKPTIFHTSNISGPYTICTVSLSPG